MTKKLLEQKNSFQGTFSAQMSRLDEKLMEIDSSLVFGSDVLARENLPAILNVEEILDQRFQEFSSEFRVNLNYSCAKYVPNDTSPSMNDVLGKLIFTKSDPSLTTADSKGLTEGTEDEVCSFKIETRDSQGQITYSGVDKVGVDIRSMDTGNVIAPEITDLKNGCYEVKYKPNIAGKYEVFITVDGDVIVDSPFRPKGSGNYKDLDKTRVKLFPNFTSIPFDNLLISWVTNYVSKLGFFTCLSWDIDRELLHSLERLALKFGLSSEFFDKYLSESFLICSFVCSGFLKRLFVP